MKLITLLLFYFLFFQGIIGHAHNEKEIASFVIKYIEYGDPNPMWQSGSDVIYKSLKGILQNNRQYSEKELKRCRDKGFELLYNNSISEYEDGTDISRMSKRRSMCYIIIALSSGEDVFKTFLNDAKNSCISNLHLKMQVKELILIDLIEIYQISKFDNASRKRIKDNRVYIE